MEREEMPRRVRDDVPAEQVDEVLDKLREQTLREVAEKVVTERLKGLQVVRCECEIPDSCGGWTGIPNCKFCGGSGLVIKEAKS